MGYGAAVLPVLLLLLVVVGGIPGDEEMIENMFDKNVIRQSKEE